MTFFHDIRTSPVHARVTAPATSFYEFPKRNVDAMHFSISVDAFLLLLAKKNNSNAKEIRTRIIYIQSIGNNVFFASASEIDSKISSFRSVFCCSMERERLT